MFECVVFWRKAKVQLAFLLMGMLVFASCAIKRPKEPFTAAPPPNAHQEGTTVPQLPAQQELQQQQDRQQQQIAKRQNDSITTFKKILWADSGRTAHPKWLDSLYSSRGYRPFLLNQVGESPALLTDYLRNASLHGLDTNYFYLNEIGRRLDEMKQEQARSKAGKYTERLKLEILMAAALMKYSQAMQYGVICPDSLDKNYFSKTEAPNRDKIMRVFNAPDMRVFLDSIQPSGPAYLAMQKALQQGAGSYNRNKEDAMQAIKINMERLRWKNKPSAAKYVWVNIPDFNLDVIENGVSTLQMKVCVGEGRTEKDPLGSKETPQLSSLIYSVQVNPIWNIPASIARKEISRYASNDPNYLSNNDIDVYKDGKRLSARGKIDWQTADVNQYTFKQRPGEQNSLGKIKFIFNNNSSVYLHDTPARSAFKKKNRAISHGCVRVEKPLDLALALFGPGKTFDQIQTAMERSYPRAKYIGLPAKIPVYLVYMTAWADDKGGLQIRNDIYGLDLLLYDKMKAEQVISD